MKPDDGGPADGATAAERPDVSVVIVTWRVRDLADRCLETLYAGTAGVRLEVIVVDNASGDGTLERIYDNVRAKGHVERLLRELG